MKYFLFACLFFSLTAFGQETEEIVEDEVPSFYTLLKAADAVFVNDDGVEVYLIPNKVISNSIDVVFAKNLEQEDEQIALFMATLETTTSSTTIYRHSMTDPKTDYLLLMRSTSELIVNSTSFQHLSVDLTPFLVSTKSTFRRK